MSAKNWSITTILAIFLCCCIAEGQQEKPRSKSTSDSPAAPLNYEYLQTPNFNCLLLPEEPNNEQWQKYAALFEPPRILNKTSALPKVYKTKQRRRRIPFNNSNQLHENTMMPHLKNATSLLLLSTTKTTSPPETAKNQLPPPVVSLSLERRIVEAMYELLEKKNYIIVLQPRHCQTEEIDYNDKTVLIRNEGADFRNFTQTLLYKLAQQLRKPKRHSVLPKQKSKPAVDSHVQRILEQLDREEELLINKIYNNLQDETPARPRNARANCLRCKRTKVSGKHTDIRTRSKEMEDNGTSAKAIESRKLIRSINDCDKSFVFLVGNQNKKDKDLLMRAVQIVNK